jgi:AbrB family looped-hinge helix DNA binding protein
METTWLSTKGQVILPKSVRTSRAWMPGMRFAVEETAEGVLLRPLSRFPKTRLEDVAGCLKYTGKPKTISQMKRGIQRQIKKRHDSGRY